MNASNQFRTFAIKFPDGTLMKRPGEDKSVMLYDRRRADILAHALRDPIPGARAKDVEVVPVRVTVDVLCYADMNRVKIPGEPTKPGWYKAKHLPPSKTEWDTMTTRWAVPDEIFVGGGYWIMEDGRTRCWGEFISEWRHCPEFSETNPNPDKDTDD